MRKIRIKIHNGGRSHLFVEYKLCGHKELRKLEIRNRTVLKLNPGRYDFSLGYEDANLELKSNMNGVKDIAETPSFRNVKCKGMKLMIHDPMQTVKLDCNDTVSIANLIEHLS